MELGMTEKSSAEKAKRLLVVDDNHELAQTYQELFEANGYQVSLARNGVQGLKHILEHAVDAILCDLSMPQLEGDTFHVTVQRIRPQLGERFIFITGNSDNPKYEKFLKKVTCPVLYKPVAVDRLLETLRRLFVTV
jgi:DNA-binding NtrC family response regulator